MSSWKYLIFAISLIGLTEGPVLSADRTQSDGMAKIPSGSYLSFFKPDKPVDPGKGQPAEPATSNSNPIAVAEFWLDRFPVTQAQYRDFVKDHSKWRKSQVPSIFADSHYLEEWKTDLPNFRNVKEKNRPVTRVSWFAAHAYCQAQGKDLPTTDQWEYAAANRGKNSEAQQRMILAWYSKPNPKNLPVVGRTSANSFGVSDLHGLIWEWTLDFGSELASEDSRQGDSGGELFCGSGSQRAVDPSNYAAFMRYSLRSSLKGQFTTANLGFRCAKEVTP